MEEMIRGLFSELLNVELPKPFPRMTYAEAMSRYGSDKPDLRIPLELVDVGDLMQEVEFKVFAEPAKDPHGRVAALCVPGGANISRKEIDDYTNYISVFGARGLGLHQNQCRRQRRFAITDFEILSRCCGATEFLERTKAKVGDIIFFGADKATVVNESLGALRLKVGHDRRLS